MFNPTNLTILVFGVGIVLLYFNLPTYSNQFEPKHYLIDLNEKKTPSLINPQNIVSLKLKKHEISQHKDSACPEGIDVVWLWVNGSDPSFRTLLEKNGKKGGEGRYRDYNTLQYSLRSVYEFAPYIKNYYIVTMNQVPSFLNTSRFEWNGYHLRIVDHKEIFPNNNDLPVFNSNALEVSLHNIKNLSSCFLYLNDDMLLGKELKPEHFITPDGKIKVYHNSWTAPDPNKMQKNLWHRSVGHSNDLLNSHFNKKQSTKRNYVSHHCYFFQTQTLKEMENAWENEYETTRKHKFRDGNDLAIPFLHGGFTVESNKGVYAKESNYYYATFTGMRNSNVKIMSNIKTKTPQCICLNDALEKSTDAVIKKETAVLNSFMDTYYPNPSPFENNIEIE